MCNDVLNIVAVISIILYFVTSSDSGSLVIDCLSANGSPDPPVAQRVFWALTEGACVTTLLKAGGEDALYALQTVSIASGLPYLAILHLMCVSILRCVKEEFGDVSPDSAKFNVSLFDVLDNPSVISLKRFVIAVVAPWLPAGRAAKKFYKRSCWSFMAIMASLFYAWILCEILHFVDSALPHVGRIFLCGFFAYVTGIRSSIRQEEEIPGSILSDACTVVFVYFLAVDQMEKHVLIGEKQNKEDPNVPLDNQKMDIILENPKTKVNESTTFV